MGGNASRAYGRRTDCDNVDLNFDMLLLSGFMAHVCLPADELCDGVGGAATAIQWSGYACDNELHVDARDGALAVREADTALRVGVTYRLTIDAGAALVVTDADTGAEVLDTGVAVGAAYLAVDASTPPRLRFSAPGLASTVLAAAVPTSEPTREPTFNPTFEPTSEPTRVPTPEPESNTAVGLGRGPLVSHAFLVIGWLTVSVL